MHSFSEHALQKFFNCSVQYVEAFHLPYEGLLVYAIRASLHKSSDQAYSKWTLIVFILVWAHVRQDLALQEVPYWVWWNARRIWAQKKTLDLTFSKETYDIATEDQDPQLFFQELLVDRKHRREQVLPAVAQIWVTLHSSLLIWHFAHAWQS